MPVYITRVLAALRWATQHQRAMHNNGISADAHLLFVIISVIRERGRSQPLMFVD